MGHEGHALTLIEFLSKQIVKNSRLTITEDTPLVSSGLIDSFALIEVLLELERVTGRKIAPGRISPGDFETVRTMLAAAERAATLQTFEGT